MRRRLLWGLTAYGTAVLACAALILHDTIRQLRHT